jgi:large subunit ribosomal protein L1
MITSGKVSFSKDSLLENIRSFMVALLDAKPEGLKGKYLLHAHISSTMGPGVEIDLPTVDPSNARFMLDPTKLTKSER